VNQKDRIDIIMIVLDVYPSIRVIDNLIYADTEILDLNILHYYFENNNLEQYLK
jgi:hypothetical protein